MFAVVSFVYYCCILCKYHITTFQFHLILLPCQMYAIGEATLVGEAVGWAHSWVGLMLPPSPKPGLTHLLLDAIASHFLIFFFRNDKSSMSNYKMLNQHFSLWNQANWLNSFHDLIWRKTSNYVVTSAAWSREGCFQLPLMCAWKNLALNHNSDQKMLQNKGLLKKTFYEMKRQKEYNFKLLSL